MSGGLRKLLTKKQLQDLGEWTCPICVFKVLSIPVPTSQFSVENLKDKLDLLSVDVKKVKDATDKLLQIEEKLNNVPSVIKSSCESFADKVKSSLAEKCVETGQSTTMKTVLRQALNEEKKDNQNVEMRKNNVMVFRLPELEHDNVEERKKHDAASFIEACNEVLDDDLDPSHVISARRFGKYDASKLSTPRPLMIKLDSNLVKIKIFRNLYKLKNSTKYKNTRLNHDMTQNEKEMTAQLYKEADQMNKDIADNDGTTEEEKNFVYRVRGPPWDRKIVSVPRRKQAEVMEV